MISVKLIVLGSKLATKDEKGDLHLCTTTDNRQFWTREPLRGGTVVQVSERKAGEKYLDRENKQQVVKKDGLNFDFVIGTASDINNIATAQAALEALNTI
jgi:hypothetical protein